MSRTKIEIGDISSCDWLCSNGRLHIKTSSYVSDQSGNDTPSPYTAPVGTLPTDLKENAIVIEVWADSIAFWRQTSCDSSSYTWDNKVVVPIAVGGGGGLTYFVDSTGGNIGLAPATPDNPPGTALEDDTLIERNDDFTSYWTYDGAAWVLNFQDSNSENFNTYFETNEGIAVPALSSDPPNPAGTNPTGALGDTYITKYLTHVVHYTHNGTLWVEDFRTINSTIASLAFSTGLTNTAGTITANISTGIAGSQTIYGGVAANEDLTIHGTLHATKTTSYVILQPTGGYVGIGTVTPTKILTVVGGDVLINTLALGLGGGGISTNTALGVSALNANTTGSLNTAIGYQALLLETSGGGNVAIGYNALAAVLTGLGNTAVGASALVALGGAADTNTAVGREAMANFVSGSTNTVLGVRAGYGAVGASGGQNLFLGYNTGFNVTSGSTNIIIGYDLYLQTATSSNTLSIGNLIFGTGLTSTGTTVSTGNVGIGLATPTARLHLPAGTATAGTAPLKLTTGTALTTPADGAFEYHTSHVYFTIGSTRYQLDQQFASANNGVSYSAGVLQLGLSSAGTGAADFTANRFLYTGAFDFSIGGSFASATTYPIFYLKGATGRIAIGGTTSPLATLDVTNTAGLGAAPSVGTINPQGIVLSTGAVATVGAQEISNPLRWRASGWGTTGSAAQTVDFISYVLPIQGTAPSGDLIIGSSINGAAYANKLFYSTTGNLSLGTGVTTTARLHIKGANALTTAFFETNAGAQLFLAGEGAVELGNLGTPLNLYSNKTVGNFIFTATANNENGVLITGSATARATASDTINGIYLTPTVVSAAATQNLNALKVRATFTDVNSASKNIFDFGEGSTSFLKLTHDGRLYGTALFNNAGDVSGTTNHYITSGTYTPTTTPGTFISTITPGTFNWIRVGRVVHVSGQLFVDPSGVGAADFTFTLPISIAGGTNGGGVFTSATAETGIIGINGGNGSVNYTVVDTSNHSHTIVFTYTIG